MLVEDHERRGEMPDGSDAADGEPGDPRAPRPRRRGRAGPQARLRPALHRPGSRPRSGTSTGRGDSSAVRKMIDLTICATVHPTAAAASDAVRAVPVTSVMVSGCPFEANAARTRSTDPASAVVADALIRAYLRSGVAARSAKLCIAPRSASASGMAGLEPRFVHVEDQVEGRGCGGGVAVHAVLTPSCGGA